MPPVVFVMLGAGALLHALWNVLLKRSEDPLATATRAMGFGLLVGAYVGVALLVAGIWLVRRPAGTGPAVRFAALTGVTIAAYSAIDRLGVQAASALAYGWVLWMLTFVLLQAWVRVIPRIACRDATSAGARAPGRDAVLGIAMLGAWLLALGALSLAPVAAVVPA